LNDVEIEYVEKVITSMANNVDVEINSNINPKSSSKQANSIEKFAKECGLKVEAQTSTKQKRLTIKDEIAQYTTSRIGNNKNLANFWRSYQKIMPRLAFMVKKYCAIPATSVASESRFSIANFVARKERSSLSSENLRYTMILREKSKLSKINK